MREVICRNEKLSYIKILPTERDYRARRITAYLNLLQDIVSKQINEIKTSANSRFKKCGIFRLESISSHPTFVLGKARSSEAHTS